MSRRNKIILIAALLILAAPLRTTCGAVDYACATAPDGSGAFYTYYEIEPLAVKMLETIIHTNLHLFYWSGQEAHSIRQP